jgi:hypothetical protein
MASIVAEDRLADTCYVKLSHVKEVARAAAAGKQAGRWATVAVLTAKAMATTKRGDNYSRFTLSDLNETEVRRVLVVLVVLLLVGMAVGSAQGAAGSGGGSQGALLMLQPSFAPSCHMTVPACLPTCTAHPALPARAAHSVPLRRRPPRPLQGERGRGAADHRT